MSASTPAGFKYRGFLSYAHADARWGKWLHGKLEGFQIDKDLVGRETPMGPVPSSLRPIFRDREDFAGGHNLTDATVAALDQSAALIVLCSPLAATRPAVNEEVRLFRWRHPDRPVIPVVIDGNHPDSFPPALRFDVTSDGVVTQNPVTILGPDLREIGDGRQIGLAKLVAGIIGVATDEIVQRAERDARRRMRRWVAGLSVVAVSLAGLAIWAESNRREAVAQRLIAVEQRSIAEEQRSRALRQLKSTQGALDYFANNITRYDIRPRSSPSTIYAFSTDEGVIPCLTDDKCSTDQSWYLFNITIDSMKEVESRNTKVPANTDARSVLCTSKLGSRGKASRDLSESSINALAEHCSPTDAKSESNDFRLSENRNFVQISKDMVIVTVFESGSCGSGGCSVDFELWRQHRSDWNIKLGCSGDAFAVRVTNEEPIMAYCLEGHNSGCAERGHYVYASTYDPVSNEFLVGPALHYTETGLCGGEVEVSVNEVSVKDVTEGYSPFSFPQASQR